MNLKVALIAGVMAVSGQSAFAATDTSCNPFARGSNCNGSTGAASVASVKSAFYRAPGSTRGASSFAAKGKSQGNGQFFARVARDTRTFSVEAIDSDIVSFEKEDITPVEGENGSVTDISAVPVPAAGFLLLAGLGGLVALRRKKA